MSQLAPRGAALVAAPLPDAGTMSMEASALAASVAMDASSAAMSNANKLPDDSIAASRAAEVIANGATADAAGATGNASVSATASTGHAITSSVVEANAAGGTATVAATPPAISTSATPATPMATPLAAHSSPQVISAHVGVPAPRPSSPATAGSIGGAVLALVLVVGLILLLAWLAKRMPGLGGASGNPALRIVGSLALGPRERVVVVAVGDTQLLLGVGAGGTRTLHTLTEPLPVAAAATPAFAQLLAQHFGKKA